MFLKPYIDKVFDSTLNYVFRIKSYKYVIIVFSLDIPRQLAAISITQQIESIFDRIQLLFTSSIALLLLDIAETFFTSGSFPAVIGESILIPVLIFASTFEHRKHKNELDILERISNDVSNIKSTIAAPSTLPISIIDKSIQTETMRLRQARFYHEFEGREFATELSNRLISGDLVGGSRDIRNWALAWCARILVFEKESSVTEEIMNLLKASPSFLELTICHAFWLSEHNSKKASLSALSKIDNKIARTAALQIVGRLEGVEEGLKWLEEAGLTCSDLDADGKVVLISWCHEKEEWTRANQYVDMVSDEDFMESPILLSIAAFNLLTRTVPKEFIPGISQRVPIDADQFPLDDGPEAIEFRRKSQELFSRASTETFRLGLDLSSIAAEEFALWIELRDPDRSPNGYTKLVHGLQNPDSFLRLVHLGMQFGVSLDKGAISAEIERQVALNGGANSDCAIARFALAYSLKKPESIAEYLYKYFDQITVYYTAEYIELSIIGLLLKSNQLKKASEHLKEFKKNGAKPDHLEAMHSLISETKHSNPIEIKRALYEKSQRLEDLLNLVDSLSSQNQWDMLTPFALESYEKTGSLKHAELYLHALQEQFKFDAVANFLRDKDSLRTQSTKLQLLFCWSLYYEGEFASAFSNLSTYSGDRDSMNYRNLKIQLIIGLGKWSLLSTHINEEIQQFENREPEDLLQIAQLSVSIGSPHTKDIVRAAASKGWENPQVLISAYFLATSSGWENEPGVHEWLERAKELSGSDGPVREVSIQNIVDRKPDWDIHENNVWNQLNEGTIPMFMAADSTGKSLVELLLFPALANQDQPDPRRRIGIPAFSGACSHSIPEFDSIIYIDVSVLLTLSMLGILENVFAVFKNIQIPHSTLQWLFQEKEKSQFHQPSRVRIAEQIRDFVATGILTKLNPRTVLDQRLATVIGQDLAQLISEAQGDDSSGDTRRIVIRSSPVHTISSIMSEAADLGDYSDVLCSCQTLVDWMMDEGRLTVGEHKTAITYLRVQESRWADEATITAGAELYLDDLSVTYLRHIGVLTKLVNAGFKLYVMPGIVEESNQLIKYNYISDKVKDIIENIRGTVQVGIESKTVSVVRKPKSTAIDEESIFHHPTAELFNISSEAQWVVSDERFLNQHQSIGPETKKIPICTSLSLIDVLVKLGKLNSENRVQLLTTLRTSGYFLLPLSGDEIGAYLENSRVISGEVMETAELRAVRESIQRIQMSEWLQLPKEIAWLHSLYKAILQTMKKQWRPPIEVNIATARSNWLLELLDSNLWKHFSNGGDKERPPDAGYGAQILLLMAEQHLIHSDYQSDYQVWIENTLLTPVRTENPQLYQWIVEQVKDRIVNMSTLDLSDDT